MITSENALLNIPKGLREPLVKEFNGIVNNFMEHRWTSSELGGGRFCEIVYTILDGHAKGKYASDPSKPSNFIEACRRLENNSHVPRSFQILIPRLISSLYEIRNNRNVGHVGSEVDPDFMDSSVVVAVSSWILAELIRVFHNISTKEAQKLVNYLTERRIPIIWKSGDVRRVLKPDLSLRDQILILISSDSQKVSSEKLISWTDYKNRSYFNKVIHQLHQQRLLEFSESTTEIELLPPGVEYVSKLISTLV